MIAAPRCAMTRRAGLWATEQVGRLARPVSQVAAELGVAWHTVMEAVVVYGTPLVEDPDRIGQVTAVRVNETKWLAAQATEPTRWVSAVVDVERPTVIDMLEGRNAGDLADWFAQRDPVWRAGIRVAVCDPHEPFRAAFDAPIPRATQVADPFASWPSAPGSSTGPGPACRTPPSARGRRRDPLLPGPQAADHGQGTPPRARPGAPPRPARCPGTGRRSHRYPQRQGMPP
jgi:hypothetical protein